MKSRRELFEEQLRDLQKDISSLSNKLATPSTTAASSSNDSRRPSNDFAYGSGKSRHITSTRLISSDEDLIAMLERSKEELRVMKKERDDATYKSEQLGKEVEELRKELTESLRLKTAYNYLKQDYESLKVSLESSERIRKQQKELIALLQRSHLVHGDTSSTISFGSNASAQEKQPAHTAEAQNRRAPVLHSQPTVDIGIAEPRHSHPGSYDQQHHYHNNNGATAITVTANSNAISSSNNVIENGRLRHSKKKQTDAPKSNATKTKRKSSSSSSSGRHHDNLDIFLSAAPPSDLSSLVSAVSNTQPLSSFSHDQAQVQYLQQNGPFVPYFERSYPPATQHSQAKDHRSAHHRTPSQSDNHVNSSSKEVSFSRQLIAPSPNPKNQPILHLPITADTMQPKPRSSSSHRSRGVTKAATSLTRRVASSSQSSLPINLHYDAMHSHKGKPPRHPHTSSHSVDDSRIHVVTPSYNQSDSSLRAQANYFNEAPFFQQFEYTGKHPPLTSRSDADLTRSSSSRASPMRLRSSDPLRGGGGSSSRSGSREVTRPRSASAAGGTRASSSRRSSSLLSHRLSQS